MEYYELTELDVSDFKDNYGNTWCDAVFVGIGEPVKWVLKDPDSVKVGEKYYGEIEEKISKAGKAYLKFKRAKPEDSSQQGSYQESPEKQDSINRAVALNNAVAMLSQTGSEFVLGQSDKDTLALADKFYVWLKNKEAVTDSEDNKSARYWKNLHKESETETIKDTAGELFPESEEG